MNKEIGAASTTSIKLVLVFVVIIGMLAAGYFLFFKDGKFGFGVRENTHVSSEVLESTVKSASDLVTTKYHYKNVMPFSKDKPLSVFGKDIFTLGTEEKLFIYAGEICVGYDVSQIKINVDDSIKVIKVTLPEPKVIAHTTFDDQFEEYEIDSSVWVKTTTEDIIQKREEIKKKQEEILLEDKDFIKEFNKNTELALKVLLNTATGNEGYDIAFL